LVRSEIHWPEEEEEEEEEKDLTNREDAAKSHQAKSLRNSERKSLQNTKTNTDSCADSIAISLNSCLTPIAQLQGNYRHSYLDFVQILII